MNDQLVQDSQLTRVYPSKRDAGLVILAWGAILLVLSSTIRSFVNLHQPFALRVVQMTLASGAGFLLIRMMYHTSYTLMQDRLIVRGGIVRNNIPLDEIQSISPSRSILAGPAWSLDRLEVRYGRSSILLISPLDKQAFVQDLVSRCPRLKMEGDRAVRKETA